MDQIRKLIRKKIEERGLTLKEVSEEMGRNHAYLQQFIERNVPVTLKERDRTRLAEILDIPESDLGGRPTTSPAASKPEGLIPEIDLVAGMGGGGLAATEISSNNGISFAREVIRDHWRLPEWVLSRAGVQASHVACFPAQGDSMEPTIANGDVVFIDTRHRVPSPPGIYALADEFGGVVIKRLEVTSRPGDELVVVRITSDNPLHRERELTLNEIVIVGRYIGRFTA